MTSTSPRPSLSCATTLAVVRGSAEFTRVRFGSAASKPPVRTSRPRTTISTSRSTRPVQVKSVRLPRSPNAREAAASNTGMERSSCGTGMAPACVEAVRSPAITGKVTTERRTRDVVERCSVMCSSQEQWSQRYRASAMPCAAGAGQTWLRCCESCASAYARNALPLRGNVAGGGGAWKKSATVPKSGRSPCVRQDDAMSSEFRGAQSGHAAHARPVGALGPFGPAGANGQTGRTCNAGWFADAESESRGPDGGLPCERGDVIGERDAGVGQGEDRDDEKRDGPVQPRSRRCCTRCAPRTGIVAASSTPAMLA